MTPVFLDFETTHPDPHATINDAYFESCRVVCLGALLPRYAVIWFPSWRGVPTITVDQTVAHIHGGTEIPDEIMVALTLDPPCAHNARGFDSRVWDAKITTPRGGWIDTLPLARLIGLPGSLDEIGQRLTGRGKEKGGKQALERLHQYVDFGSDQSIAQVRPYSGLKFGADSYFETVQGLLDSIVRYNVRDLILLNELWSEIARYFGRDLERLPESERRVWELDGRINARGFYFDRQLAEWLIAADETLSDDRAERIREIAPSNLRSGPQLKQWLANRGHDVGDVSRATLTKLLDDPEISDDVRLVVEARLGTARTTTQKLRSGIHSANEGRGRIRNSLVYCGAHTGRWAGRGFQPQNLPRGLAITDTERAKVVTAVTPSIYGPDIDALKRLAVEIGARLNQRVQPEALLSTVVQDVISAPAGKRLIYGDFSAIEARTLCWLANDPALSIYREGRSPYRELAAALFGGSPDDILKGSPRYQVGKAAVLGCGYGMGAAKFAALCAASGIDLAACGLEPQTVINAYRRQYGGVVRWWTELESAVRSLAVSEAAGIRTAGRVTLRRVGNSVVCDLPSGRPLVWREIAFSLNNELTYEPPRAFDSPPKLYGGKIAENVTQAVCRDLLADAMLRCEGAGLEVVLHVHDEIVIESREDTERETLRKIMTQSPEWAKDLPLEVEIGAD